ncbi:hypothetical protein AB205_0046090 [Aquarana catesbeiana]|uniref:Uncharacterized protein n=1 Tax=Aquarana catesbeiana TaxID=8400 RepID=A0A2G9QJH1_AQUCT|nr:hypothetical protein AB205_0046090 [Aquarana catesbeiana]
MVCNHDLEKIKKNMNDVQQKMKNRGRGLDGFRIGRVSLKLPARPAYTSLKTAQPLQHHGQTLQG